MLESTGLSAVNALLGLSSWFSEVVLLVPLKLGWVL